MNILDIIDYLNSKLELFRKRFDVAEIILTAKEEILRLNDYIKNLEDEKTIQIKELENLRSKLAAFDRYSPNSSYKTRAETLEAENARLKAENEMLKAVKPLIAVGNAHPARSKTRWN